MKQIFDWMREEMLNQSEFYNTDLVIQKHKVDSILDQAEQKWEEDCCDWWFDRTEKFWRCSCEEGQDYEVERPSDCGYKFCSYCGKKIREVE